MIDKKVNPQFINSIRTGAGEHQCNSGKIPLLSVIGLKTRFRTSDGLVKAVDDVSFSIYPQESLGVVGESGSGKSVTALSVLRLIQKPSGEITAGKVLFNGRDLLRLEEREMRKIRGNRIAMIFQDPMTSLNPVMTVGAQIAETIILHQNISKTDAWLLGIEMLKKVHIPQPEERMMAYPFSMSGGMRQRVMIAMALACNPELLIADEPTTALDVTIQAQILELIRELQNEKGMAVWMITHDLGVIAETCSRVIVMYAGQIVEEGCVDDILKNPLHPYTTGLIECIPKLGESRDRLSTIPGQPPNLAKLPQGCVFAERCNFVSSEKKKRCFQSRPALNEYSAGRKVRCWWVQ